MADTVHQGTLSMWLTEAAEAEQIVELCDELTARGQRLLLVDAGDLLNPHRLSRLSPSAARSIQVIRMPGSAEPASFIAGLKQSSRGGATSQILLAGIVNRLAGGEKPFRDMARELGRIKTAVAGLMEAGLDVTIVCRIGSGLRSIGSDAYFVSSLCAMADDIHRSSDAQQDINGASAAIA